jgi:hypothetical protein
MCRPTRARAVEAAVQHDANHGVPTVGRQVLGATDEIPGGVVDQNSRCGGLLEDVGHHEIDGRRLANVSHNRKRRGAVALKLGQAGIEMFLIAASSPRSSRQACPGRARCPGRCRFRRP